MNNKYSKSYLEKSALKKSYIAKIYARLRCSHCGASQQLLRTRVILHPPSMTGI